MRINKFIIDSNCTMKHIKTFQECDIRLYTNHIKNALVMVKRHYISEHEYMLSPVAAITYSLRTIKDQQVAYDIDTANLAHIITLRDYMPSESFTTLNQELAYTLFNMDYSAWILSINCYNDQFWHHLLIQSGISNKHTLLIDNNGNSHYVESANQHDDWLFSNGHDYRDVSKYPKATLALANTLPDTVYPLEQFPLPLPMNRWLHYALDGVVNG